MNNAITKEFNFGSLMKFALPTVIMMIFTSLYTIVDGIFVSRFVGTDALSAVNVAFPLINVVLAVAIMLATGGSAIIARKIGEGNIKSAREGLSLIVIAGFVGAAVIGTLGLIFLDPIVRFLGADESMFEYCRTYLGIMLIFAPASALQMLFQSFFVTAGRPGLGLFLTVFAGVVNAIFDYILIVPVGMGIAGAALATGLGYMIPAIAGIVFFLKKKGTLYFARPRLDWRMLGHSCSNGSSEMVSNLSSGVVTFLFNRVMLRLLGSDGVAAMTIVLYAQFMLTALYIGFSFGVAPVISYNHGSGNVAQIKRVFKICMTFVLGSSAVVFILALLSASTVVQVFSPRGTAVYDIALHGFLLFSVSYLFSGLNIFASAMFTAFSNGKISATISFLRTFVFIVLGLLLLPLVLPVDGVWLAVPFAELVTLVMSVVFIVKCRGVYHYG